MTRDLILHSMACHTVTRCRTVPFKSTIVISLKPLVEQPNAFLEPSSELDTADIDLAGRTSDTTKLTL